MRILILLTNPFKPDPRVHMEAKALAEAGHDVIILAWDRGENYPEEEQVDGFKIKRIRAPASYGNPRDYALGFFKYYAGVLKHLRKERYDAIHANDFDTLPLGYFAKLLHRIPVIYDAHDHYTSMIQDVIPEKITRFLRGVEFFISKRVDGRIAATEALGNVLFPGMEFVTVMNAKDLSEYQIDPDEIEHLREKFDVQDKFVIVYIGILKIWEPIPQLIKAVRSMDDVFLILGGDGPHRDVILEMLKGAKNIKYIGWVNKKDIPKLTMLSDLTVLPSDNKKEYTRVAVGNKILEGMAAGKPVIAGKGTEGGRIVTECDCGLVCDFEDVECIKESIRKVKEDSVLYKKFSENAKKCAKNTYNWDVMKRRLLSLYSRIQAH